MFQLLSNTDSVNTPVFVASASTQLTSSATTIVVNKPTGTLDGHLMIAIMYSPAGATTWTGDTGWTEVLDQGANPNLRVAYKIASSEGSSYTFTFGSSRTLWATILTYSNAAYDTIGTITTTGSPMVVTAVTTSVANCMLIGTVGCSNSSVTVTAPGSMTTRVTDNDANGSSAVVAEELQPTAGSSGTRSFSFSGASGSASGVLISIKPA